MLEPDILEPWPKPIHSVPLGALIWRNIEPLPDEAVSEGTLTDNAYWLDENVATCAEDNVEPATVHGLV
jgi:hypothetical protein